MYCGDESDVEQPVAGPTKISETTAQSNKAIQDIKSAVLKLDKKADHLDKKISNLLIQAKAKSKTKDKTGIYHQSWFLIISLVSFSLENRLRMYRSSIQFPLYLEVSCLKRSIVPQRSRTLFVQIEQLNRFVRKLSIELIFPVVVNLQC